MPYNARIFIAYDLISNKWDLIEFLCNKGNTIDLLIFGNVLVYDMFECNIFVMYLSCCMKETSS